MTGQQERPGTLAEALIALQARLPRITKDAAGQVGTREYKYATLANVYDAIFPLLADLGLYWSCSPTIVAKQADSERFVLAYELGHVSGGKREGWFPLPENVSSQAMGSAITYAERYSFNAVIGIAPADDDGAAATAEWRPPANPHTRKATRSRGTAAEDTDWTERPPDDNTPGTITDQQLAAIQNYWLSLGIPAEDRRGLIVAATGLTGIKRTRDLSRADGGKLIAYLRDKENASEGGA